MRQTPKLIGAKNLYRLLGIKNEYSSQNELYSLLIEQNYHWDSKGKKWWYGGISDPPSQLIKIRVMTDKTKVNACVQEIKAYMSNRYDFIGSSLLCPCRPPKQNDARIYLIFIEKSSVDLSKLPKNTDAVLGGNYA